MRKVAIFGGGQSGLQLALALLQNQYEVTVVSNRTPEQILSGRVSSSQFMFHDALQNEKDLGINFWESECPITEGIAFTIPGPDKTKALFWEAKLDGDGQSVDVHFISARECYVTVNIDFSSGSDARRVDLYFQVNASGNSLVFERSEPYPNPNQPLGASILASRQVERLYQTLRGVLDEDDRQLLTMQQQSWLGGRELLDNREDRVAFVQTRVAELRQD